jgi:hypothetical protein
VDPLAEDFVIEDLSEATALLAARIPQGCEACRACGAWRLAARPEISGRVTHA